MWDNEDLQSKHSGKRRRGYKQDIIISMFSFPWRNIDSQN